MFLLCSDDWLCFFFYPIYCHTLSAVTGRCIVTTASFLVYWMFEHCNVSISQSFHKIKHHNISCILFLQVIRTFYVDSLWHGCGLCQQSAYAGSCLLKCALHGLPCSFSSFSGMCSSDNKSRHLHTFLQNALRTLEFVLWCGCPRSFSTAQMLLRLKSPRFIRCAPRSQHNGGSISAFFSISRCVCVGVGVGQPDFGVNF